MSLIEMAKKALGALWDYNKYLAGFNDGRNGEERNPFYRNDPSYTRGYNDGMVSKFSSN